MALVDYSDSEDEAREAAPPAKKRKTSIEKGDLPPLPAAFRDLYSSTVRTSTQDDPTLHGGRKRVTPHLEGNWPTHVYLEWCPNQAECDALSSVISAQQNIHDERTDHEPKPAKPGSAIHSLLQNDLGVNQPLHISLSRPVVLKTEQKTGFLDCVKTAVNRSNVLAFDVIPQSLKWHPNEDGTRWFFVTKVAAANDELLTLLDACNEAARVFNQPLLYEEDKDEPSLWKQSQASTRQHVKDKFHLSLAWSLQPPRKQEVTKAAISKTESSAIAKMPAELLDLNIHFTDVKIRIGQDVTSLPLAVKWKKTSSVLS